jgi:hypothetical protein
MHNFYGIRTKVNNFRKGTILDAYDQPTYISFALDFRFEETNNFSDLLWSSPLFSKGSAENTNSAQTYLGSIGHKDKENSLAKFKSILEYLTFNAPWYFQSITGLDKLWSNATDMAKGYKGSEAVLTIKTLEALDLRMTELANLYRSAIYDKVYMRERVPDNLRWFAMDIYLAEVRNIRFNAPGSYSNMTSSIGINTTGLNNAVSQAGAGLSAITGNSDLDQSSSMKQFGYVKFKCRQCEFDFSSSMPGSGGMINVNPQDQPTESGFNIKVGYFEEESQYHDSSQLSDDFITNSLRNPWSAMNTAANIQNKVEGATFLPGVGGFVQNGLDSAQEGLRHIGGLISPALEAALSGPKVKDIGNIYDKPGPKYDVTQVKDPYPTTGSKNLGDFYQ